MSKIKILIVEDEWIVSEELKEILIKHDFEVVGQAESGSQALAIVDENTPDIALMDINIKGDLDGIELAKILKERFNMTIIFLTAYYDDYFIRRASKVDPASYFVKPFEERNLIVALEVAFNKVSKAKEEIKSEGQISYFMGDRIFVKDRQRYVRVDYKDLIFAEAEGSYCTIHTLNDSYTLAINLKLFEEKVNYPGLIRVHRSYLINVDHVDSIESHQLKIGAHAIPVSQTHREELIRRFNLI